MAMFSPNSNGGAPNQGQQFGSYQKSQSTYNPYQNSQFNSAPQQGQSYNPYQPQQPQQQYGYQQPQQQYGYQQPQQQYNPYQQQQQYGYQQPQQQYNPYQQQQYNPYQQQQQYGNPFQQQMYNPYPQQQQYNPYVNQLFQQQQGMGGLGGLGGLGPSQQPGGIAPQFEEQTPPQPPAFMKSPEFQGYQTQMQSLNDQLNSYTQQSPLYKQIQDLGGKMKAYESQYKATPQQQSTQLPVSGTMDLPQTSLQAGFGQLMGGPMGGLLNRSYQGSSPGQFGFDSGTGGAPQMAQQQQQMLMERLRQMGQAQGQGSANPAQISPAYQGPSNGLAAYLSGQQGTLGGMSPAQQYAGMSPDQARTMIRQYGYGQHIPAELVQASGGGV